MQLFSVADDAPQPELPVIVQLFNVLEYSPAAGIPGHHTIVQRGLDSPTA